MQVYVLADTTYNSLSVDEVAASHVDADCVVHYGRASLTKLSRIPAYYVFPKEDLDADAVAESLATSSFFSREIESPDELSIPPPMVVILDQVLLDSLNTLESALKTRLGKASECLVFANVLSRTAEPIRKTPSCCKDTSTPATNTPQDCCQDTTTTTCPSAQEPSPPKTDAVAGYTWKVPGSKTSESSSQEESRYIWIGFPEAPALKQLQLTHSTAQWLSFDPSTGTLTEGLPMEVSRLLRRRYFLVEKARQANIVGILVGTLGAAGYGNALRNLRQAAQAAGKKTYTLLMGKPSPAKLANFPEIEIFVLVADPQGQILDSKDYLAPIITPHEAMLAFTPESEWVASEYRLDFDHFVNINGELNGNGSGNGAAEGPHEDGLVGALVMQAQQALIVTPAAAGTGHLIEARSAADYLVHKRSWKGVEAPLVGSESKEAHLAVAGQSGRAAGYAHEPKIEK